MRLRRALAAFALRWSVVCLVALVVPRCLCGWRAGDFYDGDREAWVGLARAVADRLERGLSGEDFSTGNPRFDGEWRFGAYQMGAIGLCQVMDAFPDTKEAFLPVVRSSIDRMLEPGTRAFDTEGWDGHDAIDGLDDPQAHAAYLGYLGIAMGLYRGLADDPEIADLHDRIAAALARRVRESPTGLLETYRGETYPVDNGSVAATLALADRATGEGRYRELLAGWMEDLREVAVDPASGMLYQAVDGRGRPVDEPRASGTALGLYFLSFADGQLSRELYDGLVRSGGTNLAGFGLIREYPPGSEGGPGDIDSGPVVFGISFSGTGFALAGSRIHGDRDRYVAGYRTAALVGVPVSKDGRRGFLTGGPLGNAILLAMLTAGGGR